MILKKDLKIVRALRPSLQATNELANRRVKFLMPPHGWKDLNLLKAARQLGLIILNPSKRITVKTGQPLYQSVQAFVSTVRPGDIILVPWQEESDAADLVPEIVRLLVTGLKESGFEIWGPRVLTG